MLLLLLQLPLFRALQISKPHQAHSRWRTIPNPKPKPKPNSDSNFDCKAEALKGGGGSVARAGGGLTKRTTRNCNINMRCAWASAQARAHSQKKNGIPNRNRTRTRAQYEARASLWLPTGSELLVEVLGAQGAQGGRRFDLSLAAKRRMRLISWLAFWGSLSNRRCQIAECRARYLKPAAPIPPPPPLTACLAFAEPSSLSFKSYHHRRHKNNEVCGCGRLAFSQAGCQSQPALARSGWVWPVPGTAKSDWRSDCCHRDVEAETRRLQIAESCLAQRSQLPANPVNICSKA